VTGSPTLTFHDGHTIPQLGYGVWQVDDDVAETVVGEALRVGYRHIDTAKLYGNEAGVGRAIRASGIPRDDIFVTTKLWNDDQGRDNVLRAFDASMDRLGFDVLDLYLIHWPTPKRGLYVETWQAFLELKESGRVKSIGVSNFPAEQLDDLAAATGVLPVINQVELHPYLNQAALRAYDSTHGILTQAWSPLGQGGELLAEPVITSIAAAHDATPAQVVLAWHLALGNVVIPKSVTPERIASNFAALDVTLTADEIAAIDGLDEGRRLGPDPVRFNRG
jgi:2,5-diketo-D-gluconate reductase A